MAFYYPTISGANTLGGVNSTVTVETVTDLNTFTSHANSSALVLTDIRIKSFNNDIAQISQPISFVKKDIDGKMSTIDQSPSLDVRSFQAQVDTKLFKDLELNSNSYLNYTINANSKVRLTLTINEKYSIDLKAVKAFGYENHSWEKGVIKELSEIEEIKVPSKKYNDVVNKGADPEEVFKEIPKQTVPAFPSSLKSGAIESKPGSSKEKTIRVRLDSSEEIKAHQLKGTEALPPNAISNLGNENADSLIVNAKETGENELNCDDYTAQFSIILIILLSTVYMYANCIKKRGA